MGAFRTYAKNREGDSPLLKGPTLQSDQTPILLCYQCKERLNTVTLVLRRHASQMEAAFGLIRNNATEQQLDDARTNLLASVSEAQTAWDKYTAHLREHGIIK
jgi:hypothetical protein